MGEPFDFQRLKPGYCWTAPRDEPKYGFTVDELLGCLSDMATRDTQRCTTAVEHLFMICPCFLPPVPVVDVHRQDGQKAALESLRRLSASIRESRLRRAGNSGKQAVKTVVDGEVKASSTVAISGRKDDKVQVDSVELATQALN